MNCIIPTISNIKWIWDKHVSHSFTFSLEFKHTIQINNKIELLKKRFLVSSKISLSQLLFALSCIQEGYCNIIMWLKLILCCFYFVYFIDMLLRVEKITSTYGYCLIFQTLYFHPLQLASTNFAIQMDMKKNASSGNAKEHSKDSQSSLREEKAFWLVIEF